jgi:hypothetical protein
MGQASYRRPPAEVNLVDVASADATDTLAIIGQREAIEAFRFDCRCGSLTSRRTSENRSWGGFVAVAVPEIS